MAISEDEDYAAGPVDAEDEDDDGTEPEPPIMGGEDAARRGRQMRNEIVTMLSS
jgi:hypothetical protein